MASRDKTQAFQTEGVAAGSFMENIAKSKAVFKPLRKSIITAVCLFFFDSFILGQIAIAVFTVIAMVFWFIPRTLFALKRKDVLAHRLLKAVIYLVMIGAILTANFVNNRIARTRAQRIIDAVNRFSIQYQRYPQQLNELVPEFLAKIPLAKYTILYNNFIYTNFEGRAHLMYFSFPPYGRPYFNFNSQTWGFID